MFWNNLGCIHFAMGKHNLGIFYFKKALQENDHTCAQLGDGSNGQCESAVLEMTCVNAPDERGCLQERVEAVFCLSLH